jgi:DNA-binding transcriptional ArsR family regulator
MKLTMILDQEGTKIASDPTNQTILQELVKKEHSISELATQINLPALNLWRRIQKLLKANMVELTRIQKVGNLEKKFYRATATLYTPKQYFTLNPKDPRLKEAFEIYSDIQRNMMLKMSSFGEVPKDSDPIDYLMFASMQVFADVCGNSKIPKKIDDLKEKLANYAANTN